MNWMGRTARIWMSLICFTCLDGLGEAGVRWAQTIGGSQYDMASCIRPTADGGYIVAGFYMGPASSVTRAWIAKLSSSGTVLWQRLYGGGLESDFVDVIQTADGGFVALGTVAGKGGRPDAWIVRMGGAGAVIWQRSYGGDLNEYVYSFCPAPNDGYVVAGSTESFGDSDGDAWLFSINSAGTMLWQRTYSTKITDTESFASVRRTADGGYIAAGLAFSLGPGASPRDAWCVRTDSLGKVQWQRTYGDAHGEQQFFTAIQAHDGGYIVAGSTTSFGAGQDDLWVLRLASNGDPTWQRTFGGSQTDYAMDVHQTPDGGYILAGRADSFGNYYADLWLLKLRPAGTLWWSKVYGGSDSDSAAFLDLTADGGFCVSGSSESYGAGLTDAFVLRTASDGKIDSSCKSLYKSVSPSVKFTSATVSSPKVKLKSPALSTIVHSYESSSINPAVTVICASPTR